MKNRSRMRSSSPFTISSLVCVNCGKLMYVPRSVGCKRERGHVKDMYCPNCLKKTKHVEIRSEDAITDTCYYIEHYCGDITGKEENLKVYVSGTYLDDNEEAIRVKFIGKRSLYDVSFLRYKYCPIVNRESSMVKGDKDKADKFVHENINELFELSDRIRNNVRKLEVVDSAKV